MKRQKREASGGQDTNSVSKYSGNNALKSGVTMDHVGTSVVDLEQLDYIQVAWLLREKLNDFIEGGKRGPPGLELRSLLRVVASYKIVIVDLKWMNPDLWRTLPRELLLLVFAHLPVPDITRLRSLSKEWNRDIVTVNSEVNRALDETRPCMVACFPITDNFANSEFRVTICDLSNHRSQYSYRLHPGDPMSHENRWCDMGAHDGGLVCFVSTWKHSRANPLCIVVVNLLTRVQRKLPPLQISYYTPPQMVHIEVDSKTKSYRVVVVGFSTYNGRPTVRVYKSSARSWTRVTPTRGFIFGVTHSRWMYSHSGNSFRSTTVTRSVYDFAGRQLKHYDGEGPAGGASVMAHVYQKDCMFVLHRNTFNDEMLPAPEGYRITKYRIQSNARDWVPERSYLCSPLQALLEEDVRKMSLSACEGFLMLFPSCSDNDRHFWLLDFASGVWSSLPDCFPGGASMIRAFRNVVP